MRLVLDTCILKLATFPSENNASALNIIRHEPDNRFLECALAAKADYIATVNTARGHFDQSHYQAVRVVRPRQFLDLRSVQLLLRRLSPE